MNTSRSEYIDYPRLTGLKAIQLGPRHRPVPPATMADAVRQRIEELGFPLLDHRYAINPKLTHVVGLIVFDHAQVSLGHGVVAYSQPMGRRDVGMWFAGGCLRGSALLLGTEEAAVPLRRQAGKVEFLEEVTRLTTEAVGQADRCERYIKQARAIKLSELLAYRIIGEILVSGMIPKASLVRFGYRLWTEGVDDPDPLSLWGLHLAYMHAVAAMSPITEVPAALAVGRYFAGLVQAAEAAGAV